MTTEIGTDIHTQAAAIDLAAVALVTALESAAGEEVARVSATQLRVLTLLDGTPTLNVNGLAARLGVGASSASRMCDRLEALGLLRREADGHDRREVQLRLTTDAQDLLTALAARRRQALAAVLAGVPPRSRRELVRALTAFATAAAESADADTGELTAGTSTTGTPATGTRLPIVDARRTA